MGEVIPNQNGDGVFTGREPHNTQESNDNFCQQDIRPVTDLITDINKLKVFDSYSRFGRQYIKLQDFSNNLTITLGGQFSIGKNDQVD